MPSQSMRASGSWYRRLAVAGGLVVAGLAHSALLSEPVAAQGQAPAPAQAPAARPLALETFEKVTIVPSTSGGVSRISMPTNGRFVATNVSVPMLIRFAYGVHDFQISGGPAWFATETFDIEAHRSSELVPQPDGTPRLRARLRQLLADKFKLKVRVETQDLPIYQLVTARSDGRLGPQLRASNVDCAALAREFARATPDAAPPDALTRCGIRMQPGALTGGGVKISELARSLARLTGRVVENKTALQGTYDVYLEFFHELAPPADVVGTAGIINADATVSSDGPAIAAPPLPAALPDQLGLRLRPVRGPVDVLVITNVERPKKR